LFGVYWYLNPTSNIEPIVVILTLILLAIEWYKRAGLKKRTDKIISNSDRILFQNFLADFPSNSNSISLLKSHNFGASYHQDDTDEIDIFLENWNSAEKKFRDVELESKRKDLWGKCNQFINELYGTSYSLNGGPRYSCIPDAYRGKGFLPEDIENHIKHLNEISTECYQIHQELISLGKEKLDL